MDTGNTFIAGQDPVAFLGQFIDRLNHVHVKDVSPSLAAATRGKQAGIAISHCALGDGVNAENIKKCLALLRDHGYDGVLSMECEGPGRADDRTLAEMDARDAGRVEHSGGLTIPGTIRGIVTRGGCRHEQRSAGLTRRELRRAPRPRARRGSRQP